MCDFRFYFDSNNFSSVHFYTFLSLCSYSAYINLTLILLECTFAYDINKNIIRQCFFSLSILTTDQLGIANAYYSVRSLTSKPPHTFFLFYSSTLDNLELRKIVLKLFIEFPYGVTQDFLRISVRLKICFSRCL